MTTLMQANREWMSRPADERFSSVAAIHAAAQGFKDRALRTDGVPTSRLRVADVGGDVKLIAKGDLEIGLTNWSFGQLATVADAPASYLSRLPAKLAVENLNHGLARAPEDKDRPNRLLFDRAESGMATLRALTSTKYTRIWNTDVTSRLVRLEQEGPWQPAPAAFDGSRGLYLGDRDMFAFMVDNDRRIFEKGPGGGLSRGFFVSNSEVGAKAFKILTFFYNFVCGNHMVWGASGLQEVKIRHVGNADSAAFEGLEAELIRYAESSATEDDAKVEAMRRYVIGKDKEEVLDTIMKLRFGGLGAGLINQAYDLAVEREDWYGAPNTMWGFAGGLTEIARDLPNADARTNMEAVAGKLMEIAF